MKRVISYLATLIIVPLSVGCSPDASPDPDSVAPSESSIDVSTILLDEEPSGARELIAVRGEAQHDDEVVVVGRIGGSKSPWVEGHAAFSIVDTSLLACSDREGDDCPFPWDYCCETDKLPTSKALVKFVDDNGKLLPADARKLFAVKELQTVVIRGTARRDDAENLTIVADEIFVRK